MIYVTGDTHGDLSRLDSLKLKKGDTLIICGDFGFIWDGSGHEEKVLRMLGKKKFNICFIDGTHENFDLLAEYDETLFCGGKAQNISGNLYHLMRGQIYNIEGHSVFCMGGGESPDVEQLMENGVYSRKEYPHETELREAEENLAKIGNRVDFIITHEPPASVKDFLCLHSEVPPIRSPLNAWLDNLAQNVDYTRWFFGSMHIDKTVSLSRVAVFEKIINAVTGETF